MMNIFIKRLFLITIFGSGTMFLIGFMYEVIFVNVPYQDAPLELLRQQSFHKAIAHRFYFIGATIFSCGLLIVCGLTSKLLISLLLRNTNR